MTEIDNARIVLLSAQLAAEKARADKAEELSARLKLEAQCHAGEAHAANSTIYEIYQVLSSGKGEPGNWHGAEPAREYVRAAETNLLTATKALEPLPEMIAALPPRYPSAGHQYICGYNDARADASKLVLLSLSPESKDKGNG